MLKSRQGPEHKEPHESAKGHAIHSVVSGVSLKNLKQNDNRHLCFRKSTVEEVGRVPRRSTLRQGGSLEDPAAGRQEGGTTEAGAEETQQSLSWRRNEESRLHPVNKREKGQQE